MTERVRELGLDELAWVRHWVAQVPRSKRRSPKGAGDSAWRLGDDCGRAPRSPSGIFAAFSVDLTPFPTLVRIADTCAGLDAFERAHADCQPASPALFAIVRDPGVERARLQ